MLDYLSQIRSLQSMLQGKEISCTELTRAYLDAMERDPLIMEVLGEHVARHYIEGKRKEWAEYQARVSGWELEKYLVTY